jgi:alpha/beta hydrolase fold
VVLSAGGSLPDIGRLVSRCASLRLDWLHGKVRDLRKNYERACGVPLHRFHGWRTVFANGRKIRILLHDRERVSDCAIFYFHGGGWIVGSPATHGDLSRALSVYTDLPVISIDYRLAPEDKATAAVADGLEVLNDFLSPAAAPPNLQSAILCGDSAGASVAMAVERVASLDLKKRVLGVASFYSCFGRQLSRPLQPCGRREDGLDARCLNRYWTLANTSHGRGDYTLSALDHVPGSPVYRWLVVVLVVVHGRKHCRRRSGVRAQESPLKPSWTPDTRLSDSGRPASNRSHSWSTPG